MKIEKFKVLLYLKKSRPDKSGKAPIMGRITVNRSMVQFSCKISCTPDLWNPRESRLNGKSNEAVEVNAKLDKLLLSIHEAFDTLVERKMDFDAEEVKNLFQGSLGTQMTLLGMTDIVCEELRKRIGIDRAKGTYPAYIYTRRTLAEFIEKEFSTKDVAFGQMTEQFIHDYQSFILDEKGLAIDTCRHYLAIVKKVCRKAYKEGHADKCFFAHFSLPKQKEKTPKALSRESFEKIRDLVILEHRASHILARDLFLFACYTETAYADAVSVTHDNPLEELEYEKKPPSKRMHISKAELKQLLELKLPANDPLKELARRTFIFSCFTGLAYVDTQLLYPHHIGRTADNRRYIRINRKKTKIESFIPLHPIAEQILDLYNTTDDTQPVFPLPSRDMMWFEIHELGVIIGCKENLSYHQARHSFGSFLISEGICTESIAKMMGHASITSTQTYAKISEKKIAEDMDRLIERRKNNEY